MNTSKNFQQVYEQLGNLFYSIAYTDDTITPKEIKELQEAVKTHWLPVEDSTDAYGTDAAYYIDISFDYLLEATPTAAEAWERFEAFYTDHRNLFTPGLRHKILDTAKAIAHSFAGINKAELTMLSRLTVLFKK